MWSRNALTERLNLEWPIFQAPMGDFTTPALAAAVANAGGLGGLGMFSYSAEEAERRIAGFRQQSGGSLNVNYLLFETPPDLSGLGQDMRRGLAPLYHEKGLGPVPEPSPMAGEVGPDHLAVLVAAKPEVVSFHLGLPDAGTVWTLKDAGCFVICSATTVAEARALETAGVDGVIAQGTEAGGHRGTFTGVDISRQPGLLSLLPQVVDAVSIPLIAAGGIADGRGIAAAMMLGASAVQLGTAFLRCEEANVSASYRDALAASGDSHTVVTTMASGKPARVIHNRLIDEVTALGAEPLPFPSQMGLIRPLGAAGDGDWMVVFAGQSAALGRNLPAGDLVMALAAETTERFGAFT
jgi:nitronate monooxygenase